MTTAELQNMAFDSALMVEPHKIAVEFMDMDGAVMNRKPDLDAYEATLYSYCELAAKQRNSHFVIKDLTEVSI